MHPGAHQRIMGIDALRGLVMVFMLADHVRETFLLHLQVSDPMLVASTSGPLFASRLMAHLCAPVFVFLTGLSAFLYGARQQDSAGAAAGFLWKRGLFLVALELTVINFAWTASFPPKVIYLQVIWAIGLSMLALAALVRLPRSALVALGLAIVAGHNLLDPLQFAPGHPLHATWAVLHDRGWLELGDTLRLRTSYPVLPWIGIICLGYACGPWFGASFGPGRRARRLLGWAAAALGGFMLLRAANAYGDRPWTTGASALETVMGFFNVTKYPPSLQFTALTLGIGLLLLLVLERRAGTVVRRLAVLGAAPMFFYIVHLYVLKLLFLGAEAVDPDAARFDAVWPVWVSSAVLCVALYPAVQAFGRLKARRRDLAWLKYL
ncbi:membrane protein [Massilia sp. BSC265]|nr:membrane protein [Massilia sp. BSC265]